MKKGDYERINSKVRGKKKLEENGIKGTRQKSIFKEEMVPCVE